MASNNRASAPPPYDHALHGVNDGRPEAMSLLTSGKPAGNAPLAEADEDQERPSAHDLAHKRNSLRDHPPNRGYWAGRFDFLMSMIAYAVGLGNVWRFPYLCYENGGGAFFIPYFLCWILAATPIFFMEVSVGQFLGEGGISAYRLCPIFKGVGWANQIIASMCNIYYCIIVAWAFFYVLSSFSGILPWEQCGHWWNMDKNGTSLCYNSTALNDTSYLAKLAAMGYDLNDTETPVEQFWERRVLQTTQRIEDTGYIQWELCLMMIAVWIFTYFALWKGITSSRKMIYICALSPYVLLIILLLRGVTLEGAGEGIMFYLKPNMTKLATTKVWKDAGTQIFYSFGIGFGTLIALGSYNHYRHNVYRDAVVMCFINSSTSVLAGFVVFSVLGYMARAVGKTVGEVVKGGVGLAFLVYPEAIVTLPLPQLWSVLFFLMIMILGLDSQVVMVEGVITALADQFPILLRKKKIFVAVMCVVCGFLALPMVTQSGQYWLRLMDNFGASGITLLFVVFFEVVALSWGFGAEKIYMALEDMIGYRPSRYWFYCWKYSAPIVTVCIFAFIVGMYEPLKYSNKIGTPFPDWAQALGLMMSLCSMVMIPGYAIFYLATTSGRPLKEVGLKVWLLERLRKGVTPAPDVVAKLNRIAAHNAASSSTPANMVHVEAGPNSDDHKKTHYDPKYSPQL